MALTAAFARLRRAASPLWRDTRLRRAGVAVLVGLSLAFLVLAVVEAGSAEVLASVDGGDVAVIGLCGIAYGLLLVLLARSWALSPASLASGVGYRHAIAVYGTSILPKYIPGSILQYGSRQVLGSRLGWNAAAMAHGSVLEVALHVVCSLAVALLLLAPLVSTTGAGGLAWYAAAILIALCVAVAALVFVGRRLPIAILLGSALYQLAFFAGLAALAALCGATFGVAAEALPAVAGLFLVSWLIGFVMPLAPGGIGVREASGVALLSGTIGLEPALLVLASMRIVSLIGDVLIFVAGVACQRSLRLAR